MLAFLLYSVMAGMNEISQKTANWLNLKVHICVLLHRVLSSDSNGCNAPCLRSLVVDRERMRPVVIFPARSQCFFISSVLWHCWLDVRVTGRAPDPENLRHLFPEVLFWNRWRKRTWGLHGKHVLKWSWWQYVLLYAVSSSCMLHTLHSLFRVLSCRGTLDWLW